MSVLKKYKGYEGTAEVSVEDGVCHGKILFIQDLVTYEAETVGQLEMEFHAAVDDYLQSCQDIGKNPDKPCGGVFNVRVSPELHRQAILRSFADDLSLNEVVVRALNSFLNPTSNVNHNVKVIVEQPARAVQAVATGTTDGARWGVMTNVH